MHFYIYLLGTQLALKWYVCMLTLYFSQKLKSSKASRKNKCELSDIRGVFLRTYTCPVCGSLSVATVEELNGRNIDDIFYKSSTGVCSKFPFSFHCFLPVEDKGKDHRCLRCCSLWFPASTCASLCVCLYLSLCVCVSLFLYSTKPKNGPPLHFGISCESLNTENVCHKSFVALLFLSLFKT